MMTMALAQSILREAPPECDCGSCREAREALEYHSMTPEQRAEKAASKAARFTWLRRTQVPT